MDLDGTFLVNHALHSVMDEANDATAIRGFRDNTTDSFTNTFHIDTNIRNIFIDYTWSELKIELSYLNSELMKLGYHPLNKDENVLLLFKGGTVMNFHFADDMDKKILQTPHPINDIKTFLANDFDVKNNTTGKINISDTFSSSRGFYSDLRQNFKISDIDYSLYILTFVPSRYRIIYSICAKLLWKGLSKISNFFDSLLKGTYSKTTSTPLTNTQTHRLRHSVTFRNFLTDKICGAENGKAIKGDMIESGGKSGVDNLIREKKLYLMLRNVQIKRENIYDTSLIIDAIEATEYANYVNAKIGSDIFETENISIFRDKLEKIMQHKRDALFNLDFYGKKKIADFKNMVATSINKMLGETRIRVIDDGLNEPQIDNIKLAKQIIPKNLELVGKENFVYSCNNDEKKQYEGKVIKGVKNVHYITFNDIINAKKEWIKICFKLMRIKLNVEAKDAFEINNVIGPYKIPSEFVDVSIVDREDSKYQEYIDHYLDGSRYINLPSVLTDGTISPCQVSAYSTEDIYNDLYVVLFEQRQPWSDPKYLKRIKRTIYVACEITKEKMKNSKRKRNYQIDFVKFLGLCNTFLNNIDDNTYSFSEALKYCGYNSIDEFKIIMKKIFSHTTRDVVSSLLSSDGLFDKISASIIYFYALFSEKIIDKRQIMDHINDTREANDYVRLKNDDVTYDNIKKKYVDLLKMITEVGYLCYYNEFIRQNLLTNKVGGKGKLLEKKYKMYLRYRNEYMNFKYS